MRQDTDPTEHRLSNLKIIRHTTLEKLKHCIEDVVELDYHSGSELYEALERLKKFYEENKHDIH